MMIQSQQLLSPPPNPKPHPQPLPPNNPLPLPPHRESRMMIQRISHPHPLLFLAALPHPQEDAVKSLIRVPPKLFYALSYDGQADVCRIDVNFYDKIFSGVLTEFFIKPLASLFFRCYSHYISD